VHRRCQERRRARAWGKLQGAWRKCQPFRVVDATERANGALSWRAIRASVLTKMCKDVQGSLNIDSTVQRRHEVPKLHSRKFPRSAPGSHAPTARGRSSWWVRRWLPVSRNARAPARRPTSASGLHLGRTHPIVHHPRFSSPMCLARSWPGKVALHRHVVRRYVATVVRTVTRGHPYNVPSERRMTLHNPVHYGWPRGFLAS